MVSWHEISPRGNENKMCKLLQLLFGDAFPEESLLWLWLKAYLCLQTRESDIIYVGEALPDKKLHPP